MRPEKAIRWKRRLAVLLCVTLAAVLAPALGADGPETGKTVRVGWYESAFHRTDSFGRKSGYGYEYQQKVSAYTGWTYEYVEGSWSELFVKLQAGEIDLLSDVSYTPERAKKILYSAESMGSEDYHAFISRDNTEISPDDFSTFNGKKVGVNRNSIQEELYREWELNHDVHSEIVELTGRSPELIQMLENGEIDILVTLDAYGTASDMVPVCKTGSSSIYFGISRSRPDLKEELDVAMNRILEENRYYNRQLAEKYEDGQGINGFVTPDEKKWLSAHDVIRVGYLRGFMPFCDENAETHTLTGALADYLATVRDIERNAKLNFEPRPYDSVQEALDALDRGEIDCAFPINMTVYDGEKRGLLVTDPCVRAAMYAAVRPANFQGISRDQQMRAIITEGNLNYESFLMDYFPEWEVLYCQNTQEGFESVASGNADCMLISNYRLSILDGLSKKYRLTALPTGETLALSFAVRRQDDRLYSILNKANHLVRDSDLNSSLTNYALSRERVTFEDFLRDNLIYVVIVAAVIIVVILLLLIQNIQAQRKASEGSRIISETEHDRLTNLYNRDFFFVYANRLYHEHPEKQMDAIVINIEHFHTVNTLNGRDFGDDVLRTLGQEISAFAAEHGGIAGRFESDRFDIYCEHLGSYKPVLDRLQSKMNETFHNADIRLRMGVMPGKEGMQPEPMFDQARSACSSVRGSFKTHLMVYDEELRQFDQFNLRLQNDLGSAIESQEIEVFYQPKFDIRSEMPKLSSAEALIRWRHPELGMIMPSDFIPLFERSGQISELDRFVWEQAAKQVSVWKEKYGTVLPMSVNLSRVDVFDPHLQETLDALIAGYGLDRKDLKLEITESAYTENAEHMIEVIRRLRESGYEIEMDDFGSGYSSLNMLSSMPIDVLKMDKEFIRNMEHDEKDILLVELILDIARSLKVPVIAEGVETEGQLKLLREMGCALVQGFYFSKPLATGEFEERFLKQRPGA